MNKLTVVHIGNSMHGGGAEAVFRQTVSSLKKLPDTEFSHFVASAQGNEQNDHVDLMLTEFDGGSLSAKIRQIFSFRNYRLLRKFLFQTRPQIIHIQNYGNLSPAVLVAIWMYKKARPQVKVIQTLHTFQLVCSHFAGYDYRKNKRCVDCQNDKVKIRIFYRRCSRGGSVHSIGKGLSSLIADWVYNKGIVDHWITPSNFMKEMILPKVKDPGKITVLFNPIKEEFLMSETPIARKENVLVYFGRISEEKNLLLLCEALNSYKNNFYDSVPIKVKIIGDGEQKQELIAAVRKYNLDFVEFLPFLKTPELKAQLEQATVSVLPSKCFENLPLFVIESVMNDIFPITADHGGMKELIDWVNTGYKFVSEDQADLSERIFNAFINYGKNYEDIHKAKIKIKNNLAADIYSRKIIALYRELLN